MEKYKLEKIFKKWKNLKSLQKDEVLHTQLSCALLTPCIIIVDFFFLRHSLNIHQENIYWELDMFQAQQQALETQKEQLNP